MGGNHLCQFRMTRIGLAGTMQLDILSNRTAAATVERVDPNELMDFRSGKSVLWSSRSTPTAWIRPSLLVLGSAPLATVQLEML